MTYDDSSGGSPNPAKPTPLDFICDVDMAIKKCTKTSQELHDFYRAWVDYDSSDPIEINMHAESIFGQLTCLRFEQGLGALFVKRNIYPVSGERGYFHTVRTR